MATDWSPASLQAIDYLINLKALIQDIRVVHVAAEKQIEGSSVMHSQKTYKDTKARLEKICDGFKPKA